MGRENTTVVGDDELVWGLFAQAAVDIWGEQMFPAISIPSEAATAADWEATERQRLFSPLALDRAE